MDQTRATLSSCTVTYFIFTTKGYVLIEFPTVAEAKAAIAGANGTKLLDQTISVDFAFVRPPPGKGQQGRGGRGNAIRGSRARSRSPKENEDNVDGVD